MDEAVSDPMPVFVLKAQDVFAVRTIDEYRNLLAAFSIQAHLEQVDAARKEIVEWQKRNPEKIKVPYHKHVPVGGTSD